jgi:hypothetical protein
VDNIIYLVLKLEGLGKVLGYKGKAIISPPWWVFAKAISLDVGIKPFIGYIQQSNQVVTD